MLRKLLYHSGIDDETATYVTNYVAGFLSAFLCFLYVLLLVRSKRKMRPLSNETTKQEKYDYFQEKDLEMKQPKGVLFGNLKEKTQEVNESFSSLLHHFATIGVFLSFFFMLASGGYVHQKVQEIDGLSVFLNSILFDKENFDVQNFKDFFAHQSTAREKLFVCYVVWEMGNMFGGLLASFYFVSISSSFKNIYYSKKISMFCYKKKNFFCKLFLVVAFAIGVFSLVFTVLNIVRFKNNIATDIVILKELNKLETEPNIQQFFIFVNSSSKEKIQPLTIVQSLKLILTPAINNKSCSLNETLKDFVALDLRTLWNMTISSLLFLLSVAAYSILTSVGILNLRRSLKRDALGCDGTTPGKQLSLADTSSSETRACTDLIESAVIQLEGKKETDFLDRCACPKNRDQHFEKVLTGRNRAGHRFLQQWMFCCVGSWIIFLSGLMQFVLSFNCSHENAFAAHGCLMPDAFNHNALFHVLLAIGIFVFFLGKTLMFHVFIMNQPKAL